MKRVAFPLVFLGVVVVVLLLTTAPLTQPDAGPGFDLDVPGLMGLETVTPQATQTSTPSATPTLTPTQTLLPATATPIPEAVLFTEQDQQILREFAEESDILCLRIDATHVWDECLVLTEKTHPYNLLAFDSASYKVWFEEHFGVPPTEIYGQWSVSPMSIMAWPTDYSGQQAPKFAQALHICATVKAPMVHPAFKRMDFVESILEMPPENNSIVIGVFPVSKETWEKMTSTSPRFEELPPWVLSENIQTCGDYLMEAFASES